MAATSEEPQIVGIRQELETVMGWRLGFKPETPVSGNCVWESFKTPTLPCRVDCEDWVCPGRVCGRLLVELFWTIKHQLWRGLWALFLRHL